MASGLPLTLPRPFRERLVRLILDALHDRRARDELGHLAGARAMTGLDWIAAAGPEHTDALRGRAQAASAALAARVPCGRDAGLTTALADAALLFDAGLFFEVHELLEPLWVAASGADREALQGLIQVAIGYQHLANGNRRGARALLQEGSAKLESRRLAGVDLALFGRAVRQTIARVDSADFDWTLVPAFPREAGGTR